MRVIAGKYGGRKLVSFRADHIRPTTDRVKEAIFSKIQFEIAGAEVLDLFSGTGSLAFEALSRGAIHVDAVEMSSKSVQIIKKNSKSLGVGDELKIFSTDVLKFLKTCKKSYDYILVDPPFTKKMASEVMQTLAEVNTFEKGCELFIESSSHEEMKDSYGSWEAKSQKSYGDKWLSHFIKK